jgi:NACalpha-BTF3-like transcription factor
MEALVQELAGVDKDTAIATLEATQWNVEDAIDRLLQKPVCKGDQYIPQKPKVNTGLSDEQKALCERGRWLQSKVNEVVSVAHSQIRNQQVPSAEQTEELPVENLTLPTLQQEESQLTTEQTLDSHEQTTPQVERSESLP